MPLPSSPLSIVCATIASFFRQKLAAQVNHIDVLIGAPAELTKIGKQRHRLNLFFYRFEPAGFGPGAAVDEPLLIRMFCLITAFGMEEGSLLAGENDLRLLGAVMRLLHEQPVHEPIDVGGHMVHLQAILQPLGSDELSYIWSPHGGAGYRPSLVYEMGLVPVLPGTLAVEPPLVGAIGTDLHAAIDAHHEPFTGAARSVPVEAADVDIQAESWAPRICFVHRNECVQSVALALGSPELADFAVPAVWVAGDPDVTITLRWEVWHSDTGWSDAGATMDVEPVATSIQPDGPIPAGLPAIPLPFTDSEGQAVLYAVRSYERGSDGATIELRSNPLLVTVY